MEARKVVFLPHVSEFGWFIMWHIRRVHAYAADTKVVCCRHGEEVFFPSASGFCYDWVSPVDEHHCAGAGNKYEDSREIRDLVAKLAHELPDHQVIHDERFDRYKEEHLPIGWFAQRFALQPARRGLLVDVVVAPRNRRTIQPQRNWPLANWHRVVEGLRHAGYTFAVCGTRQSTHNLEGAAHRSWDFEGCDATVELLQTCKLFLGLDSGVSHLATFLGAPSMIINRRGGAFIDYMRWTTPNYFELLSAKDVNDVVNRMLSFLAENRSQRRIA